VLLRTVDGSECEATGSVEGGTGGEGARARKSRELAWVGGIGVPSTICGWLPGSPNKLLAVCCCRSFSGDVGWVPDLWLGGDRPASLSVLFGADLSAEVGRTASFLNVRTAPLDLARLIRLGRHI